MSQMAYLIHTDALEFSVPSPTLGGTQGMKGRWAMVNGLSETR